MALDTQPFTTLYRETARHPDNAATLNELGAYFTERVLTPYKERVGGLTRKGKQEFYVGEEPDSEVVHNTA